MQEETATVIAHTLHDDAPNMQIVPWGRSKAFTTRERETGTSTRGVDQRVLEPTVPSHSLSKKYKVIKSDSFLYQITSLSHDGRISVVHKTGCSGLIASD